MIEQSVARPTGTRHHRVDAEFLNIMAEDCGVSFSELNQAFGGFPATPKKQALEIAFWAADKSGDPVERGRMIRAWSRKHGHGFYRASQHDQEPPTYGGFDPEELKGV